MTTATYSQRLRKTFGNSLARSVYSRTKTDRKLSDLSIQTKDQKLVPFVANAVQDDYLEDLGRPDLDLSALRGKREIVLKARQFGFSTLIEGLYFLDTISRHDVNTVVMADTADNSEMLFAKIRLFYDQLPDSQKPRTAYNSRRELYFPDLRSRITVLTAGAKAVGRSRTIHNLHCSEVAFWPDGSILTGLLQAVPKSGCVFLESTANGELGDGETFCNEYRSARDGGTFDARFFPWWEHDEYEEQPPDDFSRSEEEESLAVRLGLDAQFGKDRADAKLHWRRLKKAEPGMGSLFAQEYPATDDEAFRVSGQIFFTEWNPEKHIIDLTDATARLKPHWRFFGGFDWGIAKPGCFLLAAADTAGRVIVLDEEYFGVPTEDPNKLWTGSRENDPDQAKRVIRCLNRWNAPVGSTPIYADPSMWAEETDWSGKKIAHVKAFHDAGLRFVKAHNKRIHGWTNARTFLAEEKVSVVRQRCQNGLLRTIHKQIHDDHKPEDMESDPEKVEDHAADAFRYLLASFIMAKEPEEKPVPGSYAAKLAEMRKREKRRKL